jgi:multidrug efflux pump subunit AcrA (membrane-fusion protein)
MAERARSRRRRRARRRRAIALAVGVAVVATGSAVGIAATSGNGPARRLATVARASVTQTVESSGTVTSSLKLTPSFSTTGTVKSVDVQVGDTVRKGQALASLDTTSLQADVDSANSTLANAKQQLEADKTGQTSVTPNNSNNSSASAKSSDVTPLSLDAQEISSPTPSTTATAAPSAQPTSSDLSGLIRQVEAAQTAVITAQQHVDAAQAEIDTAQQAVDADVTQNTKLRDAQHAACATSGESPSPSPSESSSSDSAACSAAMADYEASADALAADMAILDGKISDQDGNLDVLNSAIAALDKLVDQLQAAAAGSSGGPTSPSKPRASASTPNGSNRTAAPNGSRSNSPSGQSSPSAQSSSSPSTSEPASAAQLAADQAAIDAAEAQLKAAEQDLAAATLKSPAAGKVAAVGLTAGASSSGETITIVGTGVAGVDATVSLSEANLVKVGQSVSVAVDGVAKKLHGTVESVGLLSSTSNSTTTIPITIKLDSDSPDLFDGSGADVVITTGTAADVIAVPNSAIHSGAGASHTVTVLNGGKTSTVRVTLGVAGRDLTQIKSGLKVGDQVVLADFSQPLPSSTTNSSNGGVFRLPGLGQNGFGRFSGR